jgi:NAD kinase
MKKEEEETSAKPNTNQLVLNEVVIDRGPSPYLSNIDLYLDGKLITSVQVYCNPPPHPQLIISDPRVTAS